MRLLLLLRLLLAQNPLLLLKLRPRLLARVLLRQHMLLLLFSRCNIAPHPWRQ
jgi:hypothetical protein